MGTRADELKSDLERRREVLGEDLEAVGDRVSPGRMVQRRRAAFRQRFGRIRDQVMGTADSARSGMSDAAGTATDKASEGTRAVKDQLSGAPQAVGSAIEGNPLAAGVIAFGAGLLAASLVPATKPGAKIAFHQIHKPSGKRVNYQRVVPGVGHFAATCSLDRLSQALASNTRIVNRTARISSAPNRPGDVSS